jgi:hypothetical protein
MAQLQAAFVQVHGAVISCRLSRPTPSQKREAPSVDEDLTLRFGHDHSALQPSIEPSTKAAITRPVLEGIRRISLLGGAAQHLIEAR